VTDELHLKRLSLRVKPCGFPFSGAGTVTDGLQSARWFSHIAPALLCASLNSLRQLADLSIKNGSRAGSGP
jgi:hypothetical protein